MKKTNLQQKTQTKKETIKALGKASLLTQGDGGKWNEAIRPKNW
jgi:hypothetical protein